MEIKPLIPLGGYVAGADASVDKAVKMFPAIERFLRREMREPASLELVQSRLQILFPVSKRQNSNYATNHRHLGAVAAPAG